MNFPPHFLDEIRARFALSSLVGRRVKLIKKGREFHGLCPFHNEKTPSFTVNDDKGFFHCFGCGAHGDAIGFEMRMGNLSFPDAVEKLATELGMEVPRATPEERARDARRASLYEVMEAATRFYEQQLRSPAGREGMAYLRRRGLSDSTIAAFRLGWSPSSPRRDALRRALVSETMPETLLLEAGLLKASDHEGGSFDLFRERVMFPITDRRGRVVAFGARTLGDGQPKYLNSPETPLFHKGHTLYGLAQAQTMARDQGRLLVVEGYMDVIALHQAGFACAVAPLGTAVTEEQITILWTLVDEPILCFDGDNAGQRAMLRATERGLPILRPGKSLRLAVMPADEDPDSLLRDQGNAAFAAVLDAARPLADVVWQSLTTARPLDTPERRAAFERDWQAKVAAITDEGVRRQYHAVFRDRQFHLFRPQPSRRPPPSGGKAGSGRRGRDDLNPQGSMRRDAEGYLAGVYRPTLPATARHNQELLLLALPLHHPALLDSIAEELGERSFADSALDALRQAMLAQLDQIHGLDFEGFCSHLRKSGQGRTLEKLQKAGIIGQIAAQTDPQTILPLWRHVFALYTRRGMLADVQHAVEAFTHDPTEAHFTRLAGLLASRSVGLDDAG